MTFTEIDRMRKLVADSKSLEGEAWLAGWTAREPELTALRDERDQALVGEAYANGMCLAAVEAWESRALKAEAEQTWLAQRLSEVEAERDEFKNKLRNSGFHDSVSQVAAALSSTPTPEHT